MKNKTLAEATRELKETEKGVDTMCRILEEMCSEARAEGRAEGKAELIGKWQQAVLEILECHFAPLPPTAAENIKKVSDPEELQILLVSLWKVKTLQEALAEIKRHAV